MNEFAQILGIIRDFVLIIVAIVILIIGLLTFKKIMRLLQSFDSISEQVYGITTKFSQKFINPVGEGTKLGFGLSRFISFFTGVKNNDKEDNKNNPEEQNV